MFDHEFKKSEIATYLKEFNKLMSYASMHRDMKFFDLFKMIMRRDNKIQYAIASHYNEMIDIYEIILLTKYLKEFYDNYFEFLLDEITEKFNISNDFIIFPKKISKKEIITNLKEAFDNEKFYRIIRVDEDSTSKVKIEILYTNHESKVFHAIIDAETLKKICLELHINTDIELSYIQLTGNNLFSSDEISLRRYYIKDYIPEKNKKDLLYCINNRDSKSCEIVFLENGMDYEDYYYKDVEYAKIGEDLKYWGTKKISGYEVMEHLLRKVMPFSSLKERPLLLNLILTDSYMRDYKSMYSDMENELKKIGILKKVSIDSPLYLYIKKYGANRQASYEIQDYENIISITNSIYYGYMFSNIINEDEIEIDNKKIPRIKLSNSFNNFLWYKCSNERYMICNYENEREYNSNSFKTDIDNIKLDRYLKDYDIAKEEGYMDIPIHFMIEDKDNFKKTIGLSFIKDNVYYFYNLNKEYLLVCGLDQKQRYATLDEMKIFMKELENLSEEERLRNNKSLENIKKVLGESIFAEVLDSKIKII